MVELSQHGSCAGGTWGHSRQPVAAAKALPQVKQPQVAKLSQDRPFARGSSGLHGSDGRRPCLPKRALVAAEDGRWPRLRRADNLAEQGEGRIERGVERELNRKPRAAAGQPDGELEPGGGGGVLAFAHLRCDLVRHDGGHVRVFESSDADGQATREDRRQQDVEAGDDHDEVHAGPRLFHGLEHRVETRLTDRLGWIEHDQVMISFEGGHLEAVGERTRLLDLDASAGLFGDHPLDAGVGAGGDPFAHGARPAADRGRFSTVQSRAEASGQGRFAHAGGSHEDQPVVQLIAGDRAGEPGLGLCVPPHAGKLSCHGNRPRESTVASTCGQPSRTAAPGCYHLPRGNAAPRKTLRPMSDKKPGIFSRIRNSISSTLNDAVESVSDPGTEISLMLDDLAAQIQTSEQDLKQAMVDRKVMQRKAQEATADATKWEKKAEQALKLGDETLAREALRRKADYDMQVKDLSSGANEQAVLVDSMTHNLKEAKTRLKSLNLRRGSLMAQARAAKKGVPAGQLSDGGGLDKLSAIEDRIAELEAFNEVSQELGGNTAEEAAIDAKLADLEGDSEVDDALAALKAKMSGAQKSLPKADD